jgi:broad specificity phosphatase PhoE
LVYFIRHAQSEANKQRYLASKLPVPITQEGLADSKVIASQLSEIVQITKIISSPLVRAVQTAQPFADEYFLDIVTDPRLEEQNLGVFTGLTYDEVKTMKGYETNPLNRWNWRPTGGESYSQVADRVLSFFMDREQELKTQTVLIVTHAVTFRMIRAVLEDSLPAYPESFPNNGEIWEVDFLGLGKKHQIRSIFLGKSKTFNHLP